MANPTGSTYLQANAGYVWTNGDIYQIPQTDTVEGAATGASFSGLGVENAPHQVLLNKVQYLYSWLSNLVHGNALLSNGSGTFIVPGRVNAIWVRAWAWGGNGGGSVAGFPYSGGGGGGGAYFEQVMNVVPGQPIPWAVITTSTTFGPYSVNAGQTGGNATSSNFGVAAAGGTLVSPPGIAFPGTAGESGRAILNSQSGTIIIGGEGGASFGCGHSHFAWVNGIISAVGANGVYPGQGGSGGVAGGNGGIGAPGAIFIIW